MKKNNKISVLVGLAMIIITKIVLNIIGIENISTNTIIIIMVAIGIYVSMYFFTVKGDVKTKIYSRIIGILIALLFLVASIMFVSGIYSPIGSFAEKLCGIITFALIIVLICACIYKNKNQKIN